MNILLVTDSYPPEIRSASHLMLELAEELDRRGHKVTVITTWPQYNLDEIASRRTFFEYESEGGINVVRVKTLPHHNVGYILRGLAQLIMPLQFLWKLKRHRVKVDAVVVYSPPLPLAMVGVFLRNRGARYVLNVQDLFPQNAIDLGILHNRYQISFFRALERYAYDHSDVVTVHSEGNLNSVLSQHPNIKYKLKILHNWVDIEHHNSSNGVSLDFRKKWGLKHKHIAIFAGVMGPSQYLKLLLQIAESFQDDPDLLFLMVGDGSERLSLESEVLERGMKNVRFQDFISREEYPELLKICSIGLVCLSPDNKTPVVPGKILGYMAAALPVAAFLQVASDGHYVIKESNCGVSAYSNDVSACINAMKQLLAMGDGLPYLGELGLTYAKANFSKETCISLLEEMLTTRAYN